MWSQLKFIHDWKIPPLQQTRQAVPHLPRLQPSVRVRDPLRVQGFDLACAPELPTRLFRAQVQEHNISITSTDARLHKMLDMPQLDQMPEDIASEAMRILWWNEQASGCLGRIFSVHLHTSILRVSCGGSYFDFAGPAHLSDHWSYLAFTHSHRFQLWALQDRQIDLLCPISASKL